MGGCTQVICRYCTILRKELEHWRIWVPMWGGVLGCPGIRPPLILRDNYSQFFKELQTTDLSVLLCDVKTQTTSGMGENICKSSTAKGLMSTLYKEIQLTLFSIVAVVVCIPTNSVRGFPFLHTLSSIYCLQTFGQQPF